LNDQNSNHEQSLSTDDLSLIRDIGAEELDKQLAARPTREVLSTWVKDPTTGGWSQILKIPTTDNKASPQYVIVDPDPWHECLAEGLNCKLDWGITASVVEVWCNKPRRYYPLKCFLMNVTTEDKVRCLDGNEFNLRLSNLVVDRPPPKPIVNYRDYLDPSSGRTTLILTYRHDAYAGL
jgi:hypothetical protein